MLVTKSLKPTMPKISSKDKMKIPERTLYLSLDYRSLNFQLSKKREDTTLVVVSCTNGVIIFTISVYF